MLRFFGGRSFAEVGTAAGVTENAAKKRVTRALEKLHRYFARRGVSSTTAMIAGMISANSVHAAPAGLAKAVAVVAAAKGAAAGGSTLTLIKGALKIMAWTKAKTAVVVGVAALLAVGTTPMVLHPRNDSPKLSEDQKRFFSKIQDLTGEEQKYYASLAGTSPEAVARHILEACCQADWAEFAKYWPSKNARNLLDDNMKSKLAEVYAGAQIVSLGKAFWAWDKNKPSRKIGSLYVPYELRFKSGDLKIWQLAMRYNKVENQWYWDGGL